MRVLSGSKSITGLMPILGRRLKIPMASLASKTGCFSGEKQKYPGSRIVVAKQRTPSLDAAIKNAKPKAKRYRLLTMAS